MTGAARHEKSVSRQKQCIKCEPLIVIICHFQQAIELVKHDKVDITSMITHNFELVDGATAFSMQANYEDNMIKTLIKI